ncbi:baseplate hub domain-containing protein [Bradyrhizobium elkanii]|uniref:baseplate hub domain-containing protein n=1 Tax=Bradyrhizobium elkanii TaxID=29448 RepID=UPI00272AB173|nr:DUF2163 domain-containing protein [Bradyrhizobium elkanii]WLA80277.1 DUF2163 domain-containing protein [Bradyrhizobium elkanii]
MKDFAPLAITEAVVGFPARVCVITRRDGTIIRIAESDEPIDIDGDVFSVVPGLQISAVKHTANGEMPSCQIVAIHQLGGLFDTQDLDIGLFDAATVQIYIVDRSNLSRKGLHFTGAFANITYSRDNTVSFDVKGPAVNAKILMMQKRSPMCRTDLFSVLCGADKNAYDVSTTVASIVNQFKFTVTGSLPQPDGYFNQGVGVTSNGVAFEIGNWAQDTQTITAYSPCDRLLAVGVSVTLYPGCDKTLGVNGCAKFGRQLSFQGEPHFLGTAAAAQQV